MASLLHQKTGRLIGMSGDTLIISKEWFVELLGLSARGISDAHARIVRLSDGYYLEAIEGHTVYNGIPVPTGGRILLEHNGVLAFGPKKDIIFFFKDEEQAQKRRDTQRLRVSQITYGSRRVKEAAEQFAQEFFTACPTDLTGFAKALIDFMVKKFRINRGVVYRVEEDGKKWIPIFAKAKSNRFTPPHNIIDQVQKKREPVLFSMTEVDDAAELSKSIVQDHVYSAICFPFIVNGIFIGVLYMDTQVENVLLSENDLGILCTLFPSVSVILHILIETELDRASVRRTLASFYANNTYASFVECQVMNKDIQSFSLSRKTANSDFYVHCSIVPRNLSDRDASMQAAAYMGILTLLECALDRSAVMDVYGEVRRFIKDRFIQYRISLGICELTPKGVLNLSGVGKLGIIVKPTARSSFMRAINEKADWDKPDVEAFHLEVGTKIYLSSDSAEKVMALMDTNNFDQIGVETLRAGTGGGVYTKILQIQR